MAAWALGKEREREANYATNGFTNEQNSKKLFPPITFHVSLYEVCTCNDLLHFSARALQNLHVNLYFLETKIFHLSSQPRLPKTAALPLRKSCYAAMLALAARDTTWQSCRKMREYTRSNDSMKAAERAATPVSPLGGLLYACPCTEKAKLITSLRQKKKSFED